MSAAPLRVLIADDEQLARRRLVRLLGELPGVELVGECASGQEVLAAIAGGAEVDVVLLDIRMPGLSGIEAGALLPDDGPDIIYTTGAPEAARSSRATLEEAAALVKINPAEYERFVALYEAVADSRLLPIIERDLPGPIDTVRGRRYSLPEFSTSMKRRAARIDASSAVVAGSTTRNSSPP